MTNQTKTVPSKIFWDSEKSEMALWVAHEHHWTTPRGPANTTTCYLSKDNFDPMLGDRHLHELENALAVIKGKVRGANRHNHIRTVIGFQNGPRGVPRLELFRVVRKVGDVFELTTHPDLQPLWMRNFEILFEELKQLMLEGQPKI